MRQKFFTTKAVLLLWKILQNSQENLQQVYNFIKKETPVKVFSCEFCEIFQNSFFVKHLWPVTAVNIRKFLQHANHISIKPFCTISLSSNTLQYLEAVVVEHRIAMT